MREDLSTARAGRETLAGNATPTEEQPGSIARQWADAVDASTKAERVAANVSLAVETEEAALPNIGPAPEAPDAADYVSEATRAEDDRLTETARRIARDIRTLNERIANEADCNPAYRAAWTAYETAIADWHKARTADEAQRRAIKERHGLDRAEHAANTAHTAKRKATESLIGATIRSQTDALAVMAAVLSAFHPEDLETACGSAARNLHQRLAPWLPTAPKTWT